MALQPEGTVDCDAVVPDGSAGDCGVDEFGSTVDPRIDAPRIAGDADHMGGGDSAGIGIGAAHAEGHICGQATRQQILRSGKTSAYGWCIRHGGTRWICWRGHSTRWRTVLRRCCGTYARRMIIWRTNCEAQSRQSAGGANWRSCTPLKTPAGICDA